MPAGVLHPWDKGFVGHINGFMDRQGVHVRPQRYHWTGLAAFEQPHHAMFGYVGSDLIESEPGTRDTDQSQNWSYGRGRSSRKRLNLAMPLSYLVCSSGEQEKRRRTDLILAPYHLQEF